MEPSKRDNNIGWVLLIIAIILIVLIGLHTVKNLIELRDTNAEDVAGYIIGSLFGVIFWPGLFIYSSYYYLSGKNADRIAKKKK